MSEERLPPVAENFCCPKCRGRHPDVRDIVLNKSTLLDLLPSKDNRYIEVTCTLCGYTEFYNRAVYLRTHAPTEASDVKRVRARLAEKPNGG